MPVYSGQHGVIKIGPRTSDGWAGPLRDIGDVEPDKGIDITLKVNLFDVKSVRGGQLVTKERLIQEKQATLKFSLREWVRKNVAMQLLGPDTVVEAGTVTEEPLPTVAEGDLVMLRNPRVSSVVLVDSAGSPVTLNASHYELEDAEFGGLKFKNVAALTQPILADYSYAERIQVPILGGQLQTVWVTIELINTADALKKLRIDLYAVQFDAAKVINLIQTKGNAAGEMEGMLLADPTKPNDPELGQFGRVMLLEAA
jgi:hypothetical protein